MPKGSCNPGAGNFNYETLAKGNGTVILDIRWSWDGISVYPNCAGNIEDLRVRNTGTQTWYAHLPQARGGLQSIPITPGVDNTISGSLLSLVGLVTISDARDLTINQTP